MTRLFLKMALIIVPSFLLAAGSGLHVLVERDVADADDLLAIRIGNAAARTTAALGRVWHSHQEPQARPIATELLNQMLADQAIRCAELRRGQEPIAVAPRGLGCRVQEFDRELAMELPALDQSALVVRYATSELAMLREARRDQAFAVLTAGLVLTVVTAALAFWWFVERPLGALLHAIKDGHRRDAATCIFARRKDELGVVIRAFRDLRERLRVQHKDVETARKALQNIYDSTPTLLCTLDSESRILQASSHCLGVLCLHRSAGIGRKLVDFVEAHEDSADSGQLLAALRSGEDIADMPLCIRVSEDERLIVLLSSAASRHGDTAQHLCVLSDVTELRSAQDQLRRQALTDSLTGLPNRRALTETMAQAMADTASRCGGVEGVVMVDLDNFKTVNDSCGHDAGDALLVEAASRLRETVGEHALAARLGGDEFAVLCLRGSDPERIAQAIVTTMAMPFGVDGAVAGVVSASVGLARPNAMAVTPASLLTFADAAMYHAKKNGKGRVHNIDMMMENAAS